MRFENILKKKMNTDRVSSEELLTAGHFIAQQNYLMKSGASSRRICTALCEGSKTQTEKLI